MTLWPSGVTGWLWEQMGNKRNEVTATEARMLDDLQMRQGLLGIKELNDIRQDALHRGENIFDGKGETDGHSDAFRHAYWNARMTQRFGPEWTAEFATAHERNPSSHPTPVAMDLHNNEVGRRIAMDNPDASPDELAQLIEQAVNNGELKVIDEYDKVVPSDRVDKGRPGRPDPATTGRPTTPSERGTMTPASPRPIRRTVTDEINPRAGGRGRRSRGARRMRLGRRWSRHAI